MYNHEYNQEGFTRITIAIIYIKSIIFVLTRGGTSNIAEDLFDASTLRVCIWFVMYTVTHR